MDLSIPPTPLPGGLPPGGQGRNRPIFRAKCVPKPLRNNLLTSIVTFFPFETVSGPKFTNFGPLQFGANFGTKWVYKKNYWTIHLSSWGFKSLVKYSLLISWGSRTLVKY